MPLVPRGPLRGIVPWRAKATARHQPRRVRRRRPRRPRRPATAVRLRGRSTRPSSRTAATCCRCTASPAPAATTSHAGTILVDNKTFALTSAGARPGRGRAATVRLRVRPWGAKAATMVFTRRRAAPRGRPAAAVPLRVEREAREAGQARARGGRDLGRRPRGRAADPARRPPAAEAEAEARSLRRAGAARDRLPDRRGRPGGDRARRLAGRRPRPRRARRVPRRRRLRGTDVAAPYTFGWNAAAEAPGRIASPPAPSAGRRSRRRSR